jgi:hypothetical protein
VGFFVHHDINAQVDFSVCDDYRFLVHLFSGD